jgi:DNA-directed RNA polymerase delta subunit
MVNMTKNLTEKSKFIAKKQGKDLNISPADLVFQLLEILPQKRAKDVIIKRFGLDGGEKKTLEEIGKSYGITRERVRQIESATLAELKKSKALNNIKQLEKTLESLLQEHGEIMEHETLVDTFTKRSNVENVHRGIIEFILELSDKFVDFNEDGKLKKSWGLRGSILTRAQKIINAARDVLDNKNKPFEEKEIVDLIAQHKDVSAEDEALKNKKAVLSYLKLSKEILKNPFNEWGLSHWNEISPRGVRDKAYVVLKKNEKPLHFRKITELINEKGFSKKKANIQTVHNELIKDSRFVLVGRGIYALTEWGYKAGTVADVIISVLKNRGQALPKDEIVKEVLKQRLVKKNTIILALQDKAKFQREAAGVYRLAE